MLEGPIAHRFTTLAPGTEVKGLGLFLSQFCSVHVEIQKQKKNFVLIIEPMDRTMARAHCLPVKISDPNDKQKYYPG